MFESTATWAEDKVFDAADDYAHTYMGRWADTPRASRSPPSTDDREDVRLGDLEPLARATLRRRRVRQAWALSQADRVARRLRAARPTTPRSAARGVAASRPSFARLRGRHGGVGPRRQRHPRGVPSPPCRSDGRRSGTLASSTTTASRTALAHGRPHRVRALRRPAPDRSPDADCNLTGGTAAGRRRGQRSRSSAIDSRRHRHEGRQAARRRRRRHRHARRPRPLRSHHRGGREHRREHDGYDAQHRRLAWLRDGQAVSCGLPGRTGTDRRPRPDPLDAAIRRRRLHARGTTTVEREPAVTPTRRRRPPRRPRRPSPPRRRRAPRSG